MPTVTRRSRVGPAHPQEIARLHQERRRVAETIRRCGIAAENVIGDPERREPSFASSIGLFGLGRPEVLVSGLSDGNAGALITDVVAHVRAAVGAGQLPGLSGRPGQSASSRSRTWRRRTLPIIDFGSSSTTTIRRGTL
ncbi:DUF4262 domain-containing protein [Microbacterium thalli]|uniref:DUF4262 domain-containing protein n=1 Tax=Microbacterium thalli TaxID=3027921 RepID=UPI0034521F1D